jgi:Virulence factor membrane-bound polymerase, C-terminal/Protein glycosylation ligase/O-Antigen ligase
VGFLYLSDINLKMRTASDIFSYGKPSTHVWPYLAAVALSLSWLLPNHYIPWAAFHADAWAALWTLGFGVWLLCAGRARHSWTISAVATLMLAIVPLLQWNAGLIATSGQAIVSTAFLLAISLTLVAGRAAHSLRPYLVIHCVFAAIGLACVVSVGLQLVQWLDLYNESQFSLSGILIMRPPIPRPFANIAQPNQLATLLVWGVIAGLWAYAAKAIRFPVLIVYGMFLMFGLALTQSRIGALEMIVVCIACFVWQKHWPDRRLFCYLIGLVIAMFAMQWLLPHMSELLSAPYEQRDFDSLIRHADRMQGYKMFVAAVWQQPWWGYGVTHLATAQMAAVDLQPHANAYFLNSHNFILDLVLWLGLPLGLIVTVAIFGWFIVALIRTTTPQHILILGMIGVFGLHAMVELPHRYADMLLPVALFAGTFSHMQPNQRTAVAPRWVFGVLLSMSGFFLYAFITDYLKAEESFNNLRFEQARIGKATTIAVPKLLVLNQLEKMLIMQRVKTSTDLSSQRLEWMRTAVLGDPVPANHFTYAASLAIYGQRDEARLWMRRLNAMSPLSAQAEIKTVWRNIQINFPVVKDMEWDNTLGYLQVKTE